MLIREATVSDFEGIWPIFQEIVSEGSTYAYPQTTTKQEAQKLWLELPLKTFVLELNGEILATYYLKANQVGAGAHVCNCGYMVASTARGQGLASKLCLHSQAIALELGFKAMQFNFVASTNTNAVALWQKLGFDIVGSLPKAFKHPQQGYVNAFVMYKWLAA